MPAQFVRSGGLTPSELNVGDLPLKTYRQDQALSLAMRGHLSQFFPDADGPTTVDHSAPLRGPLAGLRLPDPFHCPPWGSLLQSHYFTDRRPPCADTMMKRIAVLTKPKLPEVKTTLQSLVSWIRSHDREVLLYSKTASLIGEPTTFDKKQIAEFADLLLVLGGDGTMLNAARLVEERQVPILGVNMGGLGFLTEVRAGDLYPALERVIAQDYRIEERLMLRGHLHRHGEHVAQSTVLNDIIVSKGALSRMIEVQATVDGHVVTKLRGDGLIVSTPTGSTAYSMSAGGPILHPSVNALILTPICPHTLTHRPLLIPSNAALELMLMSQDEGAMVTFDGQVGVAMSPGDTVTITASPHKTRLVRFPERTYYDTLRMKLKWGDG